MKKRLTIAGIFNDCFTNYKDEESNISFIVDDIENCTCGEEIPFFETRCIIHSHPSNYTLSDLDD